MEMTKEMIHVRELEFSVEVDWSGGGATGAGRLVTDDLELEWSGPASMGGRGVGTNPEELLVSAVASCYSGTLLGVLRRRKLPARSVHVAATGVVAGWPDEALFDRIVVSPTILDGDPSRRHEYEEAALEAHDRCFIGRTIAGNVAYDVGTVDVAEVAVAA